MRSRMLKASFFVNDQVASLSPLTRILFQGLWCLADREGRLENRPLRIRAAVLPFDDCDVEAMIDDIERTGLIATYVVHGQKLIQVTGFAKHQKVHPKEQSSELPGLEASKSRGKKPPSRGMQPAGREKQPANQPLSFPSLSLPSVPSETLASKDSGMSTCVDAPAPVDQVFAYWAEKLNHPRSLLDPDRRKLIRARLSEGGTVEDLCRAVDGVLVDIESWPDRRRFDGIEYVFESRASVEKFLDLAIKGNPKPKADVRKGPIRAEDQDWTNEPIGEVKFL